MIRLFIIIALFLVTIKTKGQNCTEMSNVPHFIHGKNNLDINELSINLNISNDGYSNFIYCNNKSYYNVYPFNGKVKFSLEGMFESYGDSKSRYKIRIFKIKFSDQLNRNSIRTSKGSKVYESSLIEPSNNDHKIKLDVEIPVSNGYTYYAEASFQHKGVLGWGLPKKINSNTINIRYNCFPKLSYWFNGEVIETGKSISSNINNPFSLKFDFTNTINCGNTYFISIEESDAWMERNPATQVGKWENMPI